MVYRNSNRHRLSIQVVPAALQRRYQRIVQNRLSEKMPLISFIIRLRRTMIDHLRAMAIFQSVAELGSFRNAAQRLKLSPSEFSHHIVQLEDHHGLPLLNRSTRCMSLTDADADLLAACQRMSATAQEGIDAINRRIELPVGKLSITTNASMAHRPFSNLYAGFAVPTQRCSSQLISPKRLSPWKDRNKMLPTALHSRRSPGAASQAQLTAKCLRQHRDLRCLATTTPGPALSSRMGSAL